MEAFFVNVKKGSKMGFLREYFIIVVILGIVFFTDFITSKNLGDSVQWMKDEIATIEEKVKQDNEYEAQEGFYSIKKKWKEKSNKLALFVEHNELEKVSNNIVLIQSNFETNETEEVMENIAELKFMLEHIEEKNQLKLKNVF